MKKLIAVFFVFFVLLTSQSIAQPPAGGGGPPAWDPDSDHTAMAYVDLEISYDKLDFVLEDPNRTFKYFVANMRSALEDCLEDGPTPNTDWGMTGTPCLPVDAIWLEEPTWTPAPGSVNGSWNGTIRIYYDADVAPGAFNDYTTSEYYDVGDGGDGFWEMVEGFEGRKTGTLATEAADRETARERATTDKNHYLNGCNIAWSLDSTLFTEDDSSGWYPGVIPLGGGQYIFSELKGFSFEADLHDMIDDVFGDIYP
jgi:hypothetical protein